MASKLLTSACTCTHKTCTHTHTQHLPKKLSARQKNHILWEKDILLANKTLSTILPTTISYKSHAYSTVKIQRKYDLEDVPHESIPKSSSQGNHRRLLIKHFFEMKCHPQFVISIIPHCKCQSKPWKYIAATADNTKGSLIAEARTGKFLIRRIP